MNRLMPTVAALAVVAVAGEAAARDRIRIVGSSTVFPFATVVAEQLGLATKLKTPVVESTGTGGGMKLFCAGVGEQHPDITNASRAMKKAEFEDCQKNGVGKITEVKIGFDGIVLAHAKSGKPIDIPVEKLWLAVAKEVPEGGKIVPNPYRTWSQIDPKLPNARIEILGPPPTSGTRDAFVELVMDAGCAKFPEVKALESSDKNRHATVCKTVREDGAWIDAGENDNLIVQKLVANKDAYGVFGYSFLEQNPDKLEGSKLAGVEPTYENIASGRYPVSRSLYFYVKSQHVGVVPGIKEYIAEFTSDAAAGPDGYLADKGLIALPDDERASVREKALALTPLTM